MFCLLDYRKLRVFFAGLSLCLFLISPSFAKDNNEVHDEDDFVQHKNIPGVKDFIKEYKIDEIVSAGELSPAEKKKKNILSLFERVKAEIEDQKLAETNVTYTVGEKNENIVDTDKDENSEYNRDSIPYNEREHPYIDLIIDAYNRLPAKDKKRIITSVKTFMMYKDEIIAQLKEFYDKAIPEIKADILKKVELTAKGEKAPYEENLITPYKNTPYLAIRLKACKSHVVKGDIAALIDFEPTYSAFSGVGLRDIRINLSDYSNIKSAKVYRLLPADDGFFYEKTHGIIIMQANDLDTDMKFTANVFYRMCEMHTPCKHYKSSFPMVIPKPTDAIAPFDTTYCSSLPSIMQSIPLKEFSSLSIKSANYNEYTESGEIIVDFKKQAYRPNLYYFSGKKQIFASVQPISDHEVMFKFPYKNDGTEHSFVVRDGKTGLEFKLGALNLLKTDWYGMLKLLFGMIEKGLLLTFITPLLLLIFVFFNSFSDFGSGRSELVKFRAKKIIISGGLSVLVLSSVFLCMSLMEYKIVYGKQFVFPIINFLIFIVAIIVIIWRKTDFAIKTPLTILTVLICPFENYSDVFKIMVDNGAVYISLFFIFTGIGILIPYIVSYFLPNYVIKYTNMNGILYKIRHTKLVLPAIIMLWYLLIILLNIGDLYKKGAEQYTPERLQQLIDNDNVVFLSVSANYSLSSALSKYVVNIATTGVSGVQKIKVLQADYFDDEAMKHLRMIGIDSPSKSAFAGPNARGGYICDGMIRAGKANPLIAKVNY